MARFVRQFMAATVHDFHRQFANPIDSPVGRLITARWAKHNRLLERKVVERLKLKAGKKTSRVKHVASPSSLSEVSVMSVLIKPPKFIDDKVLELGYGYGFGMEACLEYMGKYGKVFGVEISKAMEDKAKKRLALEVEEGRVNPRALVDLPFPTHFFDHAFHVDLFYLWGPKVMPIVLKEIYRTINPGGTLVCGMEMERLKRLEKWGIVEEDRINPLAYLLHLEPTGFVDVKVEYDVLDDKREVQVIIARRPTLEEECYDPEEKMAELEVEIKQFLAVQSVMQIQQYDPNLLKATVGKSANASAAPQKKEIAD